MFCKKKLVANGDYPNLFAEVIENEACKQKSQTSAAWLFLC
jgi:hypothetical protein